MWSSFIVADLEATEIAGFRLVSKYFLSIFSDDELWLNKATLLLAQYPALGSCSAWRRRCETGACPTSLSRRAARTSRSWRGLGATPGPARAGDCPGRVRGSNHGTNSRRRSGAWKAATVAATVATGLFVCGGGRGPHKA